MNKLDGFKPNNENFSHTIHENICECMRGKTVDVDLKHSDCDIRLDLIVERKRISRLWGQVKDTNGNYVENALVTLLRPQYKRGVIEYFPVTTTLSDCMGFYQFEIDKLEKGLQYRVTVGKS